MSNELQDAMAELASEMKARLSNPATFVRGAFKISLSVTLGEQLLRLMDGKGSTKVERTDRDFIITASDLTPDNGVTLWKPQVGDRFYIDLNDGNGMQRYDVLAYNREPAWRYCDSYRKRIRMHTKAMGAEPCE